MIGLHTAVKTASAVSGPRLSILIFHRVLAQPDPYMPSEPDAPTFDALIGAVARIFNVIPLSLAVRHLRANTLPPRALCITFDDGYADNAEIALPILLRHHLPATFFVATDFLDGGRMWNDSVIESVRRAPGIRLDLRSLGLGTYATDNLDARRQTIDALLNQLKYLPLAQRSEQVAAIAARISTPLPDNLMMRAEQVLQLRAAGMEIGAHTHTHPILARQAGEAALTEMRLGKMRLEEIVGEPITLFAYPNGKPDQDYAAEHVKMAQDLGFDCAVSTAWGSATPASDLWQLPRFTPWERKPLRFILRLTQNLFRAQTQFAH